MSAVILRFVTEAAKFIAAATGAAAVAVSAGLLSGDTQKWVSGGLAVATAFVVYFIKNAAPVPVVPPVTPVTVTAPPVVPPVP